MLPLNYIYTTLSYQQIVIGVATIVFILTMIIFWLLIPGKNTVYPPVMSNCPVNWTVNPNGTCNIPPKGGSNLGNLRGKPIYVINSNGKRTYSTDPTTTGALLKDMFGNNILGYTKLDIPGGYNTSHPEKPVVDFTSPEWATTGSVLCANFEWATKHNIEWAGITNYNQC